MMNSEKDELSLSFSKIARKEEIIKIFKDLQIKIEEEIITLPRILEYKPETLSSVIPQRFKDNVQNFKIRPAQWKTIVLEQPSLF